MRNVWVGYVRGCSVLRQTFIGSCYPGQPYLAENGGHAAYKMPFPGQILPDASFKRERHESDTCLVISSFPHYQYLEERVQQNEVAWTVRDIPEGGLYSNKKKSDSPSCSSPVLVCKGWFSKFAFQHLHFRISFPRL